MKNNVFLCLLFFNVWRLKIHAYCIPGKKCGEGWPYLLVNSSPNLIPIRGFKIAPLFLRFYGLICPYIWTAMVAISNDKTIRTLFTFFKYYLNALFADLLHKLSRIISSKIRNTDLLRPRLRNRPVAEAEYRTSRSTEHWTCPHPPKQGITVYNWVLSRYTISIVPNVHIGRSRHNIWVTQYLTI